MMLAKYTANSKGDLTGLRNLTIERAPTIPSDKAIFPEITFVITKVIIGRTTNVAEWLKVLIQVWPKKISKYLATIDMNTKIPTAIKLSVSV